MKRFLIACVAVPLLATTVSVQSGSSGRRVVRVTAERFAFSPSEIVIDVGQEIELRIKSDDTAHGFRILGTQTNLTIPKRGKGDVTAVFRGDKPGRYTFECSRMCGAGHNFMRGVLIVRDSTAEKR